MAVWVWICIIGVITAISVITSIIITHKKTVKKINYMFDAFEDGETNFKFRQKGSLNKSLNRLRRIFEKQKITNEQESWSKLIRVLTHEIMNTLAPVVSLTDSLNKNEDIFQYFKKLIKLRNEHPVLRRRDYFDGQNSSGYPEISFHGCDPWSIDIYNPFHAFGFMYVEPAADFKTKKDTFIYCAVNAHWEEKHFKLPVLPEKMQWKIYLYSGDTMQNKNNSKAVYDVCLMPRSSMVLVAT